MNHKHHLHFLTRIFGHSSSESECAIYKLCVDQVPIFKHLSNAERQKVANLGVSKKFQKGETIFLPGDRSENLFIVHKGAVKISRLSSSGKEQILRILGPGDYTGELSLFDTSVLKDMAEALESSEICMISGKEIKRLIMKYPNVAIKMLEEYSERLHQAENMIEQFGLQDIEHRLARLLLELADNKDKINGVIDLTLSISKRDLASLLGTTQETLSRRLASFQDQGLIQLVGHRRILILNEKGLHQVMSK